MCTRLLLAAHAAVDQAVSNVTTPLLAACNKGDGDCVQLLLAGGDVSQQHPSVEEPHANDKWPSHLLTLYLKILTYLSSVGQCRATSALRRTRPPAARPPVPAACTSRLHVACPPWPIRGPAEASIVASTCMPSLAHTR